MLPAPVVRAQEAGDPPWRVGRLAVLDGGVSAHGAGGTQWLPATLNVPLGTGDALWTQARSDAVIQLSGNRIVLGETTELDLAALDNERLSPPCPRASCSSTCATCRQATSTR